jgi:thioredoxin-related protein
MKKHTILSALVLVMNIFLNSALYAGNPGIDGQDDKNELAIEWTAFQKAASEMENTSKKYFIYVYTDWCSWCKRMSGSTFKDEKVVSLLNDKFVSIKLNGEAREAISFKGQEFNYVKNGNRGYHELAAALLNGKLSYPSIVFLDEEMNMIQPLPGYKSAEDLSIILTFLGDKIYENMTFDEYYKQEKGEG